MEIIVTGNDFTGKPEFIEYLKQKLHKSVSKFRGDKIHKIHAVCTESKIGFLIKLDVTEKFDQKGIFIIEHEDAEKNGATDGLIKKLELKLASIKEKSISNRNHKGFEVKDTAKAISDASEAMLDFEPIEDEEIK